MQAKYYSPSLRTIRRWIGKFTVMAIALLIGCYIYGAKIEPNWIEVVPIQLAIPNLTPAFNEFKIVQISDLHSSRFMPEKRLDNIIKLVNQQQADAITITGDIITKNNDFNARKLEEKLSKLISHEGNLAVLGNHDHWSQVTDKLKQVLVRSKITNLDNQVYVIERGTEKLAFAGLDDPYWGKPDLNRVITQLPHDSAAILLVHEPDYIEKSAKTHKFALQLSGHSHGGQIRIPFLDPLILPPGGRKYFVGLNQVEETVEYTNRGLGMTGLPIRFNSRPEITVFTLHTIT
ncbi:metallophosphoesterase [Pleurocapsa sp. PCC 7319]|uniref:metallophosphoesterase n=1 Tax=Pleurocapsa sp. PCC 7319 TaxID=118161 RepID=UPI000364870A|nr:metallophosphoesterase [Pleurocapsa sp. PCC 7319]